MANIFIFFFKQHKISNWIFKLLGPSSWLGLRARLEISYINKLFPHVAFTKMAKKYGDIVYYAMGVTDMGQFSLYLLIERMHTK